MINHLSVFQQSLNSRQRHRENQLGENGFWFMIYPLLRSRNISSTIDTKNALGCSSRLQI